MRKKVVFMGILIFSVSIYLFSYQRINISSESSNIEPEIQSDPIYHVENYLVILEIENRDIQAQVNITYNVLSGIKTDGFKRFRIPALSGGAIVEDSIEVYDDTGLDLTWSYREFTGDDDKHYKEISFVHPGFTGIKTVSMNFLMKDWIVEHFPHSEIELKNIGTFSIEVKRAEYRIIFPENYIPEEIGCSEIGTESLVENNNIYTYIFVQDWSISRDITITCKPNLTDTPRWGSLIPIFTCVGVISAITVPSVSYGLWWNHLCEDRKELIREKRKARSTYGGGGCGGGGCGGGGCGGGGCGG